MAKGIAFPALPGQWLTDAGAVADSYLLYTYAAGTTTFKATYSDVELTTANANPIVLDSSGRATVFLNPALGLYKFVLKDPTGTTTLWTRDNVGPEQPGTAPFIISGTAGETMSVAGGQTFPVVVYLSDGTGGETAGRWYLGDSGGDHSSNDALAVGFYPGSAASAGSSIAIQLAGRVTGLSGLTTGRTRAIGTNGAFAAPASGRRNILFADSTTSGIIIPAEAASQTAGPLPAINGHSLTGITKLIDSKVSATGNVGAGEDTLYSSSGTDLYSANTSTNGDFVKGVFWGTTANNANAKTLKVHFKDDDTVVGPNDNTILEAAMTASIAGEWRLSFTLVRLTATTFHSDALVLDADTSDNALDQSVYNSTVGSTVAWNGLVDDAYITITGEATANDDIKLLGGVLYLSTQA